MKQAAGAGAVVTTVGYSVQPEYRYPREGREPQIAGYLSTNIVRVRSSDLKASGNLIDAAIKAGANRVQRI